MTVAGAGGPVTLRVREADGMVGSHCGGREDVPEPPRGNSIRCYIGTWQPASANGSWPGGRRGTGKKEQQAPGWLGPCHEARRRFVPVFKKTLKKQSRTDRPMAPVECACLIENAICNLNVRAGTVIKILLDYCASFHSFKTDKQQLQMGHVTRHCRVINYPLPPACTHLCSPPPCSVSASGQWGPRSGPYWAWRLAPLQSPISTAWPPQASLELPPPSLFPRVELAWWLA